MSGKSTIVNRINQAENLSGDNWAKIFRGMWLINSLSSNMMEVNYQLSELEKEIAGVEFKAALNTIDGCEKEKLKAIVKKNIWPLEEFADRWIGLRNMISDI